MHNIFRFWMSVAIILGLLSYYVVVFLTQSFDPSKTLPFHLYNLMELTILYAFIRNQQKLIDIIAYPLIIGPTIALLFPLGSFHLGGFFTLF